MGFESKIREMVQSTSEILEETVEEEREKIDQTFDVWGQSVNWGTLLLNTGTEASWYLSIEATQDIWTSIFLATHGFYRISMISLRSGYELQVLGLYFDHNPEEYREWSKDKKGAPRPSFGKAANWLTGNLDTFRQFDEEYSLSEALYTLYDELSGFMHARGDRQEIMKSPRRVLHGLSHHRYTKESFEQWHSSLMKIGDFCNTIFILEYPVVLKNPEKANFSDSGAADRILQSLDLETREQLSNILG